jgi:hypothetical protein
MIRSTVEFHCAAFFLVAGAMGVTAVGNFPVVP